MDNIRLLLFFALAFVLLALYQAWQEDYGAAPQATAPSAVTQETLSPETGVPEVPSRAADTHPATGIPSPALAPGAAGQVHVVTDLFDMRN